MPSRPAQLPPDEIDIENLKNHVTQALDMLYCRDIYLIQHKVSERSIVFRFGVYLQKNLEVDSMYRNYNIDVEYNRNYDKPKYLSDFDRGVYPDLIIHKRGSNSFNLLVVEFKTYWYGDTEQDLYKLQQFMSDNDDVERTYEYRFGLSVLINKFEPQLQWLPEDIN